MSKKEIISSIIMALCELGIGVLLLVDPLGFTSMIFIVLGIILLVTGAMEAISYFRDEPIGGFVRQSLAIGLAEITAGLFCIFQYEWFIVTFPLLTILYGIVIFDWFLQSPVDGGYDSDAPEEMVSGCDQRCGVSPMRWSYSEKPVCIYCGAMDVCRNFPDR